VKSLVQGPTAVWALTPSGIELARLIADGIPDCTLFLSQNLAATVPGAVCFARLKDEVGRQFAGFPRHVFIMAAGIVVRSIAHRLAHKTTDPAVVVCDEAGQFAISLVSGHIGGANDLAREVARTTGGLPVITTATDVNRVPAIDIIATQDRLTIENPDAIKSVNMALITGNPIFVHDPFGIVAHRLPQDQVIVSAVDAFGRNDAGIFVDHMCLDLPPHVLVLRPGSLVAGVGCNRGTTVEEMHDLLVKTFATNRLAISSLRSLATVDLKADEPGLLALAESLNLPLTIFTRDRLKGVAQVPTPSTMVEKHIGVKSVCEAAALLATHRGRLIVPKQKTANATVAVAVDGFISSAPGPVDHST
jgi:cobalt-precorrin 5A hydrolase